MTDSNKVTITLSTLNEDNVVYDVCSNILVNNQYSVYSRHLDLKAEYELDDGLIITYKDIENDVLGLKDYSYNGLQNTNTTYVFDIPDGLGSGTDDISANQSYKWQFQFRVKNNVRNVWSAISDAAIDNNNITELSANAFEIVPVSTQNVLKNINFNSDQNERDDGKLHLSWDHPVSGNRGVVSGKLNGNDDPTIYDYEVSIFRNDVTTNQIVETFTNTQSDRITDADNTKIHNNILTIIDKNGDSSNSSGSGNTNSDEKEIKVLVKQRNEYVTNRTDISASMFYTLGKPEPPTQNTLSDDIKTSDNNTITFKWNKNNNTGFSTRELINGTLENNLTNKVISINRYRAIIEADRVNSKSPYYRLDRTSYGNTPTLSNINISNSVSRDANLYLQASDGIIDKNDVYTDTTGNSVSNINHVLVYPETTYTFSIYPRNRFFLESDNSLNVTITTSSPSANISQLTNGTIPINSSYNDLNNTTISYAQKGFLLDDTTVDNLPGTSTTLYQITKAYNNNLNNISASITHRINKNKFNDFLVDNDTDKNPNEYISATSQLDNKKLRQFRIYNVGESPSALLYVYGSDSTFADISSNNTTGTSMESMISISALNIKDEYSVTGKDPFNQGYWWQENMSYTISIDESIPNLYKNPVKLEFHTRYNEKLGTSSVFNNSSLESDGDVDDVSRIILQNSQNTNQLVYFDKLQLDPTATQNGTTDMIQISNFTNKINGVPNLYRISNSYGYDMTLNYKLENYSEYYGLNPSVNFVSHTFTAISKSDVAPRNWVSKSQCTRTTSGWTITNLPINQTTNSLGSHSSSTTSNVQIQLNMENMHGNSNHTIGSNDSTIHKFIYDKTSVDYFNNISSSIKQAKQITSTDSSAPQSYQELSTTTNVNQLNMYNGFFYSKNGWINDSGISSTNCSQYNIASNEVMFSGLENDYKWVIFEYDYTAVSGYTPFGGFVVFGDDNNTNIQLSDFTGGSFGGKEDIKIYLYIENYNMNSHYYLNIGKYTSTTFGNAAGGIISGFNGTSNGLGKIQYNNNDNTWNSGGSLIATSNTINGGWGTTSDSQYTSRPTNSNMKRTLNFIYNKNGNYNSSSAGNSFKHYLCIGIKNSLERKVKKPDLYIYAGPTSVTKLS